LSRELIKYGNICLFKTLNAVKRRKLASTKVFALAGRGEEYNIVPQIVLVEFDFFSF